MKTWIAALFILTCAFSAAAAELECWQNEIDPSTRRIYQNEGQWKFDQEKLASQMPARPNPIRLLQGYAVAKTESEKVAKMRPDKRQHCYVGCRIANDVSFEVAVYAAYYKEEQDIRDCNRRTHFDMKDIEATILGAELAKAEPGKGDDLYCQEKCTEKFPGRRGSVKPESF